MNRKIEVTFGGLVVLGRWNQIYDELWKRPRTDKERWEILEFLARNIPRTSDSKWLLESVLESLGRVTNSKTNQSKAAVQTSARTAKLNQPELRLIRNWRDAEKVCRDWMKWMGYTSAKLTPDGPDGGVDISSSKAVAQVKMEGKPVGAPPVQALAGIASTEGKIALFFSLSGFTAAATTFADKAKVALFSFNYQGEPRPENRTAKSLFNPSKN